MSNTLILTVGLPRSGKSTWAKRQGVPIVNPDSIRLALHGYAYAKNAEPHVWAMATTMVRSLFLAGHDTVILDATNTTDKRRMAWETGEWICKYRCFKASAEICAKRARSSDRRDLLEVIGHMASQFEWPHEDKCLRGDLAGATACSEAG